MLDLYDLFRGNSEDEALIAGPPSGQWESIQRQLAKARAQRDKPAKNNRKLLLWGIYALFLLLSCLSYSYQSNTEFGEAAYFVEKGDPTPDLQEALNTKQKNIIFQDTLRSAIRQQSNRHIPKIIPSEKEEKRPLELAFKKESKSTKSAEFVTKAINTNKHSAEPKEQQAISALTGQSNVLPSARSKPSYPLTTLQPGQTFFLEETSYAERLSILREEVVLEKKKRSSSYWETGLYLMPRLTRNYAVVIPLVRETNLGQLPDAYQLDDGTVSFLYFADETERLIVPQSVALSTFQTEVARQFSSGWRVGMGLLVYNRRTNKKLTAETFSNEFGNEEFALFFEEKESSVHFTSLLKYTFRNHKRLRFNLGLLYTLELRTHQWSMRNLYDGNAGSVVQQSLRERHMSSRLADAWMNIQPRGGLQYQLNHRMAIGLEVGTTFGISKNFSAGLGVHYRFR